MDNIAFVDEENIPMVHQDEGYDNTHYETPDTSRIDETSFTLPSTQEKPTSTLRLRQKVKRDKINALCRHLNVTGNLDLIDTDQFNIRKNTKIDNTDLLFLDANNQWQPLTNKQTGEFLAVKTLRDRFGGVNAMKIFLGLHETPPVLERSLRAASKLKAGLPTDLQMESIPLEDLSSIVEDIHVKTREASQNTDLDMREILAIDKALQSIQGELVNNTAKLREKRTHRKRYQKIKRSRK